MRANSAQRPCSGHTVAKASVMLSARKPLRGRAFPLTLTISTTTLPASWVIPNLLWLTHCRSARRSVPMLPSRRIFLLLALCLPTALFAGDFTYQQTTQLTGGSLLHMMKTVGVFSSQARHANDPVVSTIYLKGNRLAKVSPDNIEIIDLDKETITQIDVQKKTYTVMTFDQMKQAIRNARQQM